MRFLIISLVALIASVTSFAIGAERLRLLIVDGQNNHDWQATTPILKEIFDESGRFVADVSTSPPQGSDMSGFKPRFEDYDVVVSNYNGDRWHQQTEKEFVDYVRTGGGFVSVHAADNSFPDWPAYNEICGLGGWGGRNENAGPYVYFQNDSLHRDASPGAGGSHGDQHEFQVITRNVKHPIMRGLPESWMHTKDELYDRLRGPARNLEVLATAYADPTRRGSGRDEPVLMTVRFGQGRVFQTTLGHADYSMMCVGFITTLLRGAEWAATGDVTIPVPQDFPSADATVSR